MNKSINSDFLNVMNERGFIHQITDKNNLDQDLSTNIIIVNKNQAKILLLDKRINSFPFIINTQPTNIGLVPKIARVLPLEMFLRLKIKCKPDIKIKNKPIKNKPIKNKSGIKQNKYIPPRKEQNIQLINHNKKMNNLFTVKNKAPLVKRIKQADGGVNIILRKIQGTVNV